MKKLTKLMSVFLMSSMLLSPISCAMQPEDEKPAPTVPGGNEEDETLRTARVDAINALKGYVKQSNYYDEEWATIQGIIANGTNAINRAKLVEISGVLAAYKGQIDAVKTKTQIDQEKGNPALAQARENAIIRLQNYVVVGNYPTTEQNRIQGIITEGTAAINSATQNNIETVLANYKSQIDGVLQSAAIVELNNYVGGLVPSNYDTANWNTIKSLQATGVAALGTTPAANIPTVLASYKSQIAAVKTKGNGQQQGPTVQDVKFAKIPEKWTQDYYGGEVSSAIGSALMQLAGQSQALSQIPTDQWPTNLKDYWTIVQPDIDSVCRTRTDVNSIKSTVSATINGLICEMTSSMSSNAAATFTAQANAYRQANALNQRDYVGFYENGYQVNPGAKPAQEAALLAQINGLGINATSIEDAIPLLKTALKNAPLQAEVKQQMDNILQQWEDFAQFDGWTQDLDDIGYQGRTPDRPQQQTRASIQAANGLVL